MAFRGRGGRRGGFGDRGGRSYGNSRPMGPPDTVQEMGLFLHDCEGDLVCRGTDPTKVPQFSAQIYLENKTPIGKVDEVLGPLNGVLFTIKPSQGIQAASFKSGDRVYITPDRVLPLDRFLPKPKLLGQSRIKKKSRPGAPGGPSQRGRGRGAFRGRGVSTRGGSAHQGTNSGYGSFARGGARGSFRGQRGTSSRGGTRGTGHNNRGYSRTGGASQVRG